MPTGTGFAGEEFQRKQEERAAAREAEPHARYLHPGRAAPAGDQARYWDADAAPSASLRPVRCIPPIPVSGGLMSCCGNPGVPFR